MNMVGPQRLWLKLWHTQHTNIHDLHTYIHYEVYDCINCIALLYLFINMLIRELILLDVGCHINRTFYGCFVRR